MAYSSAVGYNSKYVFSIIDPSTAKHAWVVVLRLIQLSTNNNIDDCYNTDVFVFQTYLYVDMFAVSKDFTWLTRTVDPVFIY